MWKWVVIAGAAAVCTALGLFIHELGAFCDDVCYFGKDGEDESFGKHE